MQYPNVELVIMTDTTDVLVEALKAQRLDLVLGMLPVSDRNLAVKPLWPKKSRSRFPASTRWQTKVL